MPTNSKEYSREYYKKNREKVLAECKEYYAANREKVISRVNDYRNRNRDKVNERCSNYYRNKYRRLMLSAAKGRAKTYGLDFNIDIDDIIIPDTCPLLGVTLTVAKGRHSPKRNSPSLDRIEPSKGYVKGNVWVISHKANSMKCDATLDEHIAFVENWKQQHELGYPVPELAERFKERDT